MSIAFYALSNLSLIERLDIPKHGHDMFILEYLNSWHSANDSTFLMHSHSFRQTAIVANGCSNNLLILCSPVMRIENSSQSDTGNVPLVPHVGFSELES